MNACVEELFDDVRLMIARARKHHDEFQNIISRRNPPSWWSIQETRKPDGQYACTLVVQCQELKGMKPIAADLCNNLVHALDQLISALARVRNHERSRDLYFPWELNEEKFDRKLDKVREFIGADAAECIRGARRSCLPSLAAAHVAKEISSRGKHWELVPSNASVPAVTINRPGQAPEIINLPAGSLEEQLYFTFYEGPESLTQYPMYVLVGLRFAGVGNAPISPDSVFGSAFHFVDTVFDRVVACEAVATSAEAHFAAG